MESDRLSIDWLRVLPLANLPIDCAELVSDPEGESCRLIEFLGSNGDRPVPAFT